MTVTPVRYGYILRLALPIILANSATPLLGLVDTAVIGHVAHAVDLGGIALGALIFSFLYWGFGFLRMSTSGYVAQAQGRRDHSAIQDTLLRALLLALGIGALLMLLQWPLRSLALSLFGASVEVENVTRHYFSIRIWSAPACLANYVLAGVLIGMSRGRHLLYMQLTLNGLNIIFDIVFAGVMGMGATGIALGTVFAEWLTLLLTGWAILRSLAMLPLSRTQQSWQRLFNRLAITAMLKANSDIMIRTILLLAGFGIFNDQSARFGDVPLAANHILLQLISFSAFFLDGFAFVTESLAGQALGARSRLQFDDVVRKSTIMAAATAALLAIMLLSLGPWLITTLTELEQVNHAAIQFLPFAASYVLVSFMAFQLDGIFIGCTATRAMRNSAVLSIVTFIALCYPAIHLWGNQGLWLAFIGFVLTRAITLGVKLPALKRDNILA